MSAPACVCPFGLRVALQSLWAGPKEAPLASAPVGRLGPAPHAVVRLPMAVGICAAIAVCVAMAALEGRHGVALLMLYRYNQRRQCCALRHSFLVPRMLWQQRFAVRRRESTGGKAAVHWAQRHQLPARQ